MILAQRAEKLREAIQLLMQADALQQAAIGESDIAYNNHNLLQEMIDEFAEDVREMDSNSARAVALAKLTDAEKELLGLASK